MVARSVEAAPLAGAKVWAVKTAGVAVRTRQRAGQRGYPVVAGRVQLGRAAPGQMAPGRAETPLPVQTLAPLAWQAAPLQDLLVGDAP